MIFDDEMLLLGGPVAPPNPRPPAKRQKPLPPFDHDVPEGRVHTVLPPEQRIPLGPDRDWWRGDAFGVTLTKTPPFVNGANTTPREMVMSYMLHLYDRKWQDIMLTANAERGYSHFHLAGPNGTRENPADPTDPAQIRRTIDLMKYVQSWGFWTSCWLGRSNDDAIRDPDWAALRPTVEPFLRALIAAGNPERHIIVIGNELDSWNRPGPDGLDDIIANICAICNPIDVPVWLHFNSNKPSWQPDGMDPSVWWQQWVGRVKGICWQANHYDSAGLMSARLWDTRKILGHASRELLTSAWELRGLPQLFGTCSEEEGCLTAWEMLCATNDNTGYPPVAGSCNGTRYPFGSPI